MLTSILFVSPSTSDSSWVQDLPTFPEPLSDRNYASGVTGALLFSEYHLAGLFEGGIERIAVLTEIIASYPGHEDLKIVEVKPIVERRFLSLSTPYSGTSMFVDEHIRSVYEAAAADCRADLAAQLVNLMVQFKKPHRTRTSGPHD